VGSGASATASASTLGSGMDKPPTGPGRVQRRRTRTRAALLDAAERAFMSEGYHGVSMETLADEADVSVGSIYNLFANKAGLYLAVAERATELFAQYLARAYAASDSPLEQVMACGDAYLRFHLEHPGAFRFIAFSGVEARPPDVDDAGRAAGARALEVVDEFRDCIAAAVAAGEVSPRVDPELTSRVLFGAWNGIVALGARQDMLHLSEEAIADAIAQARRIVLDGLTDPGHRDPSGHSRARLLPIPDAPVDP
jgi:TetR/AcrR family transcriptional regulator